MVGQAEIEIARKLFEEGWCGENADAPLAFMTEDAVMRDILGHPEPLRGHEQIRNFWTAVAGGLRVLPEEIYANEQGVALSWMAYIRIPDDSRGPENKGKWLCGEGMSRLEFRDGKVSLEIDYWHGPQGMCDDFRVHFEARKAMSPEERGAVSGC
jgi:hypothetical protein